MEQSVPQRFEAQVRRAPDRLAVKTRAHVWTYAELNRHVNRLAHASWISGRALLLSRSRVEVRFNAHVRDQNEGIHFTLVYNTDIFGQTRMVEMLEQLRHLLSQIVENPEERIARFSLVTPAAEALLPNPAQVLSSKWEGAVHARFSHQARRVPERPAVVDACQAWTYAELEARSNQLANYLCASGLQPQDVVAIYGHRSSALVWALLGVLKAGGAFMILDPGYPASRLIECLRLAKPRAWIQIEAAGAPPEALEEFVATLSCRCRLELPQGQRR